METPLLRVLVFSANKVNNSLDVDNELRAIRQALDGVAVVDHLPAARAEELVSDLGARPPLILHFMGHGSPMGLELAYGRDDYRPADGQALREMLAGRGVQLVVLSSCYSASQAHQISQSVAAVVGTSEALEDDSTTMFSSAFYRALRRGATAAEAMRDGQDAVRLQHASDQFEIAGNSDWRLPVMSGAQRPAEPAATTALSGRVIAAWLAAIASVVIIALLALNRGGDETVATADAAASDQAAADEDASGDDGAPSASVEDTAGDDTGSVDPEEGDETPEADTARGDGGVGAVTGPTDFGACQHNPVTSAPADAQLQSGDDGCPVLTNGMGVPSRVDQWTVELTGGQTISYTFGANLTPGAFEILAPDDTTVVTAKNDSSLSGSFDAPATGTYTINVTNSDSNRTTTYTIRLWDITEPQTTESTANAASFPCLGGPVLPALVPADAQLQSGDDGCPVLTNGMGVPSRVDQWTVELTGGQTISYTFGANLTPGAFEILAPDDTTVVTAKNDSSLSGSFDAPATGTYTINVTNSDSNRTTTYTIRLWDITEPQTTESTANAASFPCLGGPVLPALVPADAQLQSGDDGCPVLTNGMGVPSRVDQWTVELTGGQTISYTFGANLTPGAFEILAPDDATVVTAKNDSSLSGSFDAPATGTYTINVTNSDSNRTTTYTIRLWVA